tara:strand:+ start:809 stop:1390 length:582 start_codon:yes stop_codon:yes gene_type:complete
MKKSEIRSVIKARRNSLSQEEVDLFSKNCFDHLLNKFNFENKNIGIFFPIKKFNEPNTFLFFDSLKIRHSNVYAPKSDFITNEMNFYLIESISDLQVNDYGIPEPQSQNKPQIESLDFLLVPLLAINKSGFRVGYGKGFYDKFLMNFNGKTITIGVNLMSDFVEIENLDSNDIPLDYCVSPNGIVCFNDKGLL